MNGELMRADEVRVSPFDLGLTVGVGVFETIPAYDGQMFAFDRHFKRMARSVDAVTELASVLPSMSVLEDAVHEVLVRNELTVGRGRVRMSLSGGVNPLFGGENPGNLIITAVSQDAPKLLVKLSVVPFPCNEFSRISGVKSSSFADHIAAWRVGLGRGSDEVIRKNIAGELCECAMSNLFLVRDKIVLTPHLESGCLDGITRTMVLDICHGLGLESMVCELNEEDMLASDELFITSSIREVQPAILMGSECKPSHPVTRLIARAYRKRVHLVLGL